MPTIGKNSRGQITIDGVPRFPLLIYDAGGPQFSDQYPAYLVSRGIPRFANKIDLYLNVQNGESGVSLRFANALGVHNMYALVTGNAVTVYNLSVPPPTSFNVHDNPTVNIPPAPAGPFRTQWAAHPRAFGTYLYDEPSSGPAFSGDGAKKAFTANGRPSIFTPPDFIVKVNGVQQTYNVDFTVALGSDSHGPNYTITFVVAPPIGTFNIPVKYTYVWNSILYYQGQLKSQMPGQFTFGTLLNGDLGQYLEYAPQNVGDTIGSDIYVIGQGPESQTGATYGYMNYNVSETAAMARYYALINNKTPNIILQLNKFGGQSRYITASEIRAHCIASLVEFKGRGLIGWWAFGVQAGAIHQEPFISYYAGSPNSPASGIGAINGINTQYYYGTYVLDAVDVWCDYTPPPPGATRRMDPSEFTVNGVGVYSGSPTVTMNVPPVVGSALLVVARTVGLPMRELWLSTLETLCIMIKQHESLMLTLDDPSIIVNNTTWFATPVAWRINILGLLAMGGTDIPTWLYGLRLLYTEELSRLQQVPPDTSLSDYLITGPDGQRGHVRTASWRATDYILICSYNMNPNPQTATLTVNTDITRIEVLGEGRDIPVPGNKRDITDTWGGASAKREGPFCAAHVYKLYLTAQVARAKQQGGGVAFRGQILSAP